MLGWYVECVGMFGRMSLLPNLCSTLPESELNRFHEGNRWWRRDAVA